MSGFLGTGYGALGNGAGVLAPPDERSWPDHHRWSVYGIKAAAPWTNGVLWPSSRFGGVGDSVLMGQSSDGSGRWGDYQSGSSFEGSGGQQAKKLIGTTRDSAGAVLGSCVVHAFLTASDLETGQAVSDTAGYFEVPVPYTGAHYLVAYKPGSPAVAGSTVNTLIPV